ncbi:MAG: LptF/LptG family permease, partial [Verrucomicrobia bacterium]|nr:LptF/LptG family permease [Verrucomicrobiota bacterium]
MRLLDRYIGRELIVTGLFAVATLSFVIVLGQIFKKLFEYVIEHDAPASFILTFIAYALPASLSLTIPWAFLTAVLLVFGRLSANNELIALRSAGISIPRLAVPVLGVAALGCAICLWINLSVGPRAQQNLKDAFFQMATTNPAAAFNSDRVITAFPGRKIYVGNKQGDELQNLHVFELNSDNVPMRVVYAERGWLETDLPNKQIKMRLEGTRYEQRDEHNPADLHRVRDGITAGVLPFPVSLEELYAKRQGRRRIESLNMTELRNEIYSMHGKVLADRKAVTAARAAAAAAAAAAAPSPDFSSSNVEGENSPPASSASPEPTAAETPTATPVADETPKAHKSGAKASRANASASVVLKNDLARFTALRTEHNKRFSYSLACLTFALIGIPLGITAHRQETSVGFGLS